MSGYTKGPWTAKNSGPHWNNDKIANWTIHYGEDQEHIVDHVYEEADARLISAAPDLLEALKAAMAFIKSHVADPDITSEMCDRYAELQALDPEAIIARAEAKS